MSLNIFEAFWKAWNLYLFAGINSVFFSVGSSPLDFHTRRWLDHISNCVKWWFRPFWLSSLLGQNYPFGSYLCHLLKETPACFLPLNHHVLKAGWVVHNLTPDKDVLSPTDHPNLKAKVMWRLCLGVDLTLFSSWVFDPHLRVVGFWGKPHVDLHQSTFSTWIYAPGSSLQTSPKLKVKIPTLKHRLSPDVHGSCLWGCGLELPAASNTKLPTSRVWMWKCCSPT